MSKIKVLDLFCGCGGMSIGLEKAGYSIIAGIDNWEKAIVTYQRNHKKSLVLKCDLGVDSVKSINAIKNLSFDLIVGGPPCQGFSIAGKRDINDERNLLYKGFVNFVKYFNPKCFILENVPNILSIGNGKIKEQILQDFEKLGYRISYKVLRASDYGVPQNRRRAFFVGLKNKDFIFPYETHGNHLPFISSSEAISDLPEETAEDGSQYQLKPQSEYQSIMRINSNAIYNHQITKHSDKTISIIKLVPDGGNYKSLPENLRLTRKVNIAWTRLNSQKPSFTIDTGHRHHFHYKYNRIPTVRESARLQSFPDDFVFYGNKADQEKQVGNAVPPLLIYEIGKELRKYLL